MNNTNHIPDEKIQQAFELFMSLRTLNMQIAEDDLSSRYSFDITPWSVDFWVFEPHIGGGIKKKSCIYEATADNIDDLIDMIEEELDAQRSHRKEQAHSGD